MCRAASEHGALGILPYKALHRGADQCHQLADIAQRHGALCRGRDAAGHGTVQDAEQLRLTSGLQGVKEGSAGAVGIDDVAADLSGPKRGLALNNQQTLSQQVAQDAITMCTQQDGSTCWTTAYKDGSKLFRKCDHNYLPGVQEIETSAYHAAASTGDLYCSNLAAPPACRHRNQRLAQKCECCVPN